MAGGLLLGAALAKPDGMGMGDVKLAAVMGLHMGAAVAPALGLGLASGAVAGTLMAKLRGEPVSSATVPLAPHLAAGAALVGAAVCV